MTFPFTSPAPTGNMSGGNGFGGDGDSGYQAPQPSAPLQQAVPSPISAPKAPKMPSPIFSALRSGPTQSSNNRQTVAPQGASFEQRSWPTSGQAPQHQASVQGPATAESLIQELTQPAARQGFTSTSRSNEPTFDTFGSRSRQALTSHQQPQQRQQQPQHPGSPQQQPSQQRSSLDIAREFLSASPQTGSQFDTALPLDKFEKMMSSGDTRGVHEALKELSMQTTAQAIASVIDLLPNIYDMFEKRIMAGVDSVRGRDSAWNDFVASYPDYASFRHIVEPTLNTAMEAPNYAPDSVYSAVAQIHSGLITGNGMTPSWQQQQQPTSILDNPRRGQGFNFREYLGAAG